MVCGGGSGCEAADGAGGGAQGGEVGYEVMVVGLSAGGRGMERCRTQRRAHRPGPARHEPYRLPIGPKFLTQWPASR
jgi:hypothetical protein